MEHAQAAPIDIPGPSSPRAAQVFPSDAVSASYSSSSPSPTSRGSPEPSTSSSPGSTGVRHHVRSEKLLEAAHIDPREARWRCLGGEEGLRLDEEQTKSWSDDGHDDGVLCAPKNVRAVGDTAVLVEAPAAGRSPPHSPVGSALFQRRWSLSRKERAEGHGA
ncbi:ATP dependent DNA helicase [Rhodotorula toruloides ATCC 204091]|uniref:ATP dependent DNA helicase n=1 Tax=Rhodotorula toruloides TaxID=5286 RepID=A0A2T0A6F9_RHOTO|nr:ATP dependent DNA helicase [Rhodotorula toruloides ATCC 204091]PRQ73599.1 ATP dependent DNA helicase [Rhodotorula toruloides]